MKKDKRIEDILKTKYYTVDNINNLRELIYNSAKKFKKSFAFKLKDNSGKIYGITYEQFAQDVEAVGNYLIKLGLVSKTIGVIGKNSYQWITSYIAASIVGIVVPIDKELWRDDILNFLKTSECSCLIGDRKIIVENI